MKRKFFKLPAQPVRYAPTITSRRMQLGISRANVAYKSDGGTATKDEDLSEAEAIAAIGNQVEGFQSMHGEKANKEEYEA